jgi:dienelactone hydrolase
MQSGAGRWRRRVLLAVLGLSVLAGLGVAGFAQYQGSRRALHARAGRFVDAELTPAGADAISTYWTVRLQGSNGLAPTALIRVPRTGTPPYPTGVLMGGLNRGRRVVNVHGLEEIAQGAILLSLDYPLKHGPRGSGGQIVATAARLRSAGLDTIAGILLALDYLESRGDVDRHRLFLVGASLGAPAVTIAGAVDERPAAVIALYGGGQVGSLVAGTLQHRDHRHVYPRWQAVALGHALAWWLTPLDPVRYAGRIAPRPYLMVNGDDDTLIPPGNVKAVFAAAHEPKTLVWVAGEHIEPDEGLLIGRLAGQVSDWLVARDLLPRSGPASSF